MNAYVSTATYNLIVLGGCSYYVFERGHSGWWFVLAICLLFSVDSKKEIRYED